MESDHIKSTLDGLVEALAAIEHERWAHWQRYMHSKGVGGAGGDLLIPAELVSRWQQQIDTPYAALPDEQKESDREQVRKYLPLIVEALSKKPPRR
jgi:hypothetical protein